MYLWNPQTQTWEETVEAFEILPQAYAVARRGPHKLTLNSTQTNQVFRGNTTYFVTGPAYLYGTTTFEAGTVVKFTNSVSPTLATGPHLSISGSVVWEPTSYRPPIFTAKDDNSAGETISGSSGAPSGDYAPRCSPGHPGWWNDAHSCSQ